MGEEADKGRQTGGGSAHIPHEAGGQTQDSISQGPRKHGTLGWWVNVRGFGKIFHGKRGARVLVE